MTSSTPPMSPSQPYLLRALHEWIVDNGLTPQIVVDPEAPNLDVPTAITGQERLVLNISPSAVRDLLIDNDYVSFVARFSGVSHAVLVPVAAIQAIYARENGQGMMFPDSDDAAEPEADQESPQSTGDDRSGSEHSKRPPRGRPSLKLIK
ncbi:MAG: ClpXP protease specificity-enhancing factor [Wenzhouxiangellaceae bacterium]|nr:ClpXP protease specificity-enhancing factor [Wenzhouxiangellaceae bacterium]